MTVWSDFWRRYKTPEEVRRQGHLSLVMQILGVTEDNIFNRIEKKNGADKTDKLRVIWDAIKAVMKDGLEGCGKLPNNCRIYIKSSSPNHRLGKVQNPKPRNWLYSSSHLQV